MIDIKIRIAQLRRLGKLGKITVAEEDELTTLERGQ